MLSLVTLLHSLPFSLLNFPLPAPVVCVEPVDVAGMALFGIDVPITSDELTGKFRALISASVGQQNAKY